MATIWVYSALGDDGMKTWRKVKDSKVMTHDSVRLLATFYG